MLRVAALFLFTLASVSAGTQSFARDDLTPPETKAGKRHPKAVVSKPGAPKRPSTAAGSTTGTFGVSNALNAPSTDFSKVGRPGEDDTPGDRGPTVRPSLDGNGRPVMGLGF